MSHHGRTGSSRSRLPTLALVTLGGASLTACGGRAGKGAGFGPGKPVALIAYLACASGRAAERDRLVDLLWSDRSADAGRHDLRQTLWHLRQRLGDGVVTAQHGHVALVADVTCDRDAFIAAVEAGDREQAVTVYGGDFLPGGIGPGARGFDEWADLERFRLKRVFSRTAQVVVRLWLTAGRYPDAQRLARRVRDSDPHEEDAWVLLLESLLAAGDPVRAAAEADLFERVLATNGQAAAPTTVRLLRRVRRAPEAGASQATPATLAPPLAGRERELTLLVRAWESARGGAGRHVHLVSAAGLGKTRLLLEIQARLLRAGEQVIYLAARFASQRVAFGFQSEIAAALAQRPGSAGVSPAAAAALLALNPSLSTRFVGAPDPARDDEAIRRRAIALLELVTVVSEEAPLAVLCDDLDWADPVSSDALLWVISKLGTAPVLFVTTRRSTGHTQTGVTEEIELAPLSPTAVGTLVTSLSPLPQTEWARQLPQRLHAASRGYPGLIIERLEQSLDQGQLRLEQDGWACADADALAQQLAMRAASEPVPLLVAPFESGTVPTADEHLVDGLTEGLIADMSRIRALRVISRASAMRFKGTKKDSVTIGRELNVRHIVRGTVQRLDHRLRIDAELVETDAGAQVWAAAYDGILEELPAIIEKLARGVVAALQLDVGPEYEHRVGVQSIQDVRAYECYLKARHDMWLMTREGVDRAVRHLETGLGLIGDNELLYAALGEAYVTYVNAWLGPPDPYLKEAERCARKVFECNTSSSNGYVLNGYISLLGDPPNHQQAVRNLRRALAVDANNPDALIWLIASYSLSGKDFAARPLADRLLAIDPLHPPNQSARALMEAMAGRFDDSIEAMQRAVDMDPFSLPIRFHHAMALFWGGRSAEGNEVVERLVEQGPTAFARLTSFVKHALDGNAGEARSLLSPELAAMARRHPIAPLLLAEGHALLGEDDAFEWLDTTVRCGLVNYPFLSQHDPLLARLRGNPRFKSFLERVKRQWETFEV